MRMFAQDAAFHRRVRVDETDDPEALRRLKQLEAIDRMREEGVKGLVPRSGGATSPARMRAGGSRATSTPACSSTT